jgi:probable HAF family extracellular repeat protein
MTALPPLPGNTISRAYDINDLGQIAGWSSSGLADYDPTLWDGADVINLGTLGTQPARPYAVNNSGQIIGQLGAPPAGPSIVWENGSISQIGTLGPFGATATDNNSLGEATGTSWVTGPGGFFALSHPFLYRSGEPLQDLGTLDCPIGMVAFGNGYGLNDNSQVVGSVGCVSDPPGNMFVSAAIWNPGAGWERLNDLIPPDSGWNLTSARAINNKGQIVGVGYSASSHNLLRGFLLTPDSPPIPSQHFKGSHGLTQTRSAAINFVREPAAIGSTPRTTVVYQDLGPGFLWIVNGTTDTSTYDVPSTTASAAVPGSQTPLGIRFLETLALVLTTAELDTGA